MTAPAWLPRRPIGWLVIGPLAAVVAIVALVVALAAWLVLPHGTINRRVATVCARCGLPRFTHVRINDSELEQCVRSGARLWLWEESGVEVEWRGSDWATARASWNA